MVTSWGLRYGKFMKPLITSILIFGLTGLSSCVEEGEDSSESTEKARGSKFLVPSEAQSSKQMKQHKAADKRLVENK